MQRPDARSSTGSLTAGTVAPWIRVSRGLRSPSPQLLDVVLAGVLVVVGLAESWASGLGKGLTLPQLVVPGPFGTFGFVLLATLPITVRSRFPLAVMVVSCAGHLACLWVTGTNFGATWVASFVAAFSAGLMAPDRRRATLAFAILALVALPLAAYGLSAGTVLPWDLVSPGLFVAIWMVGDRIRSRTQQALELSQRADQLERERDMEAIRAATFERTRIARELHDVIAHSLSVMVIQASAAMRILDDQPEQARFSMQAVEETGRAAMIEMRRLLGVVRHDEGSAPTDPQPSIERLPSLVQELSEAGLPVELRVEGQIRPLPAGVDVSAYRIVQEALTNVLRHAGAAPTDVTVRYLRDAVELEIVDQGRRRMTADRDAGPVGHGLVGMRERVALLHGELEAGPRAGGGFAVRARLPFDPGGAPAR